MSHETSNLKIEYSQNRIVNRKLLQQLVSQSSITEDDLVFDIGAGSGIISEALLKTGARVVAIEKDRALYLECKERLIKQDRFELYLDDFLIRELPAEQKYKVFSNIPFFHTAEIIKKLLFTSNPPEDCYLIVQKEAAMKYAGIPADTAVSLLIKPVFWLDILYYFNRYDFNPVPSVDIVLLQIEKRKCQLIPNPYYGLYRDFVVYLREGAERTIKKSLKPLFTYPQIKYLSRTLDIDYHTSPTGLNFIQYLGLFQFYLGQKLKNQTPSIQEKVERLHGQSG
jgi:23S rRNA (adenine-N6)-dimethyltransferase